MHADPEVAANRAYDTFSVSDILRLREPQALAESGIEDAEFTFNDTGTICVVMLHWHRENVQGRWPIAGNDRWHAASMFKAVAAGPPVSSGVVGS